MPKRKPNPLTSPATPKQIKREARGATRAQYGPLRREVKAEKRASRLQQKRIGGYFDTYGDAIKGAAERTQSAYGAAGAQIGQTSQQAADYAETLRQRLQKEAGTDAATRGATPDQTGSQTLAAATLARLNAANVLQGVTASQGATASSYLQDKRRIGKREEIEQKLREAQRRRSYDADLRDIARDAGAFKVAKKAEITDRERDFLLAQQAAHLNRRGQKIDARQTAASQAETRRHNLTSEQISQQNADRLARQARFDRRHPNAGEEGDHPRQNAQEQRRENQRLVQELTGALAGSDNLPKDPTKRYRYLLSNRDKIIGLLMQRPGDPSRAQAAKAYRAYLARLQSQNA